MFTNNFLCHFQSIYHSSLIKTESIDKNNLLAIMFSVVKEYADRLTS